MRIPLTALAVLLLLLAACGGDDDDSDGDVTSIEDAETCDEVGSVFLDEIQTLLDGLEDVSLDEMAGGEQPEALTTFQENIEEIGAKADDLECSDDEMAQYLEDNIDDLEAEGPVAQTVLDSLKQGIESGDIFDTPAP